MLPIDATVIVVFALVWVLVVILSRSRHKRIFDRTHLFRPYFSPARIPVDVLAYTEAEVERMRADDNPFIRRGGLIPSPIHSLIN